jgi:hypothetical protein
MIFFLQIIMIVNGETFTASTTIHDCLKRLRSSVGNCTLLPEFEPLRFPCHTHIWRILYNCFSCSNIRCFLTGTFVLYTAGIFDSFSGFTFFIALTDLLLIRCIFQKGSDHLPSFYIHNYFFTFRRSCANEDIVHYTISHGDFKIKFFFFGIDTTLNCNTVSNLNFVSLIWKSFDRYDFINYTMTLVYRAYLSLPELLCLIYYTAESGGWRSDVHCSTCITKYHNIIGTMLTSPCLRTCSCKCRVCTRQPPSFLGLASHTLFHLIHYLVRFTLDRETTHDQYIISVLSKKTPVQQLLLPDFPNVKLLFKCRVLSYKLHPHCYDDDDKRARTALLTFQSDDRVINPLVSVKQFWCRHC